MKIRTERSDAGQYGMLLRLLFIAGRDGESTTAPRGFVESLDRFRLALAERGGVSLAPHAYETMLDSVAFVGDVAAVFAP